MVFVQHRTLLCLHLSSLISQPLKVGGSPDSFAQQVPIGVALDYSALSPGSVSQGNGQLACTCLWGTVCWERQAEIKAHSPC